MNHQIETIDDDDDLRCSTPECDGRVTEEGDQCVDCRAREAYWQWQWEQHGRREVANRLTADEISDVYSDPTDSAKRERMLREMV